MTRLRGRAAKGQRVHASSPHGHWHTTTMISSIRHDGSTACMMVDGATDAEIFEIYVRQVLGPTLRQGDMVIMDNLAAHKGPRIIEAIEQRGAKVLFLPPYSPDLNPIEKMWSKVKQLLRGFEARTIDALSEALRQALGKVTPQNAINWWGSCGYAFI